MNCIDVNQLVPGSLVILRRPDSSHRICHILEATTLYITYRWSSWKGDPRYATRDLADMHSRWKDVEGPWIHVLPSYYEELYELY